MRTKWRLGLAGGLVLAASSAWASSAREIPVATETDVVVVGGTCGAVEAAVAAAQAGAKVFLLAPRTYLGDDLAGTLRLWLSPEERPATELSREVFSDPAASAVHGLPFTYEADQPSAAKHKDTVPPSRLSNERPIQSAVTDSVQYDRDVVITADLGAAKVVKEARVIVFNSPGNYQASSIRAATSNDGKQWQDLGNIPCPDLGNVVTVPIPIAAQVRYVRLTVTRAPAVQRLLLGLLQFVPAGTNVVAPGAEAVRPLHVKTTLENALRKAKVEFLYGSLATDILADGDGKPAGIVMANRAGRQAILARAIIDATEHAVVARLAGARFSAFQPGPTEARWVTIGKHALNGPGHTARKLPWPVPLRDMKGEKAVAGETFWFEHTLTLNLADDSWSARAELEQAIRDAAYHPSQLYSSDTPWLIPSVSLEAAAGEKSGDAGPDKLDLGRLQPAGVERLWVLGGTLAAPTAAKSKLLLPSAMMTLGARVGQAAAVAALKAPRPAGVKVAVAPGQPAYPGDVKEPLEGLRPLPVPARIPEGSRGLPVLGRYDVVVIGGGTSGACAGIGAARQGARTLVVEYLHGLGGVGTLGMIGKWWYGNRVGFTTTVPQNPVEARMEWLRHEIRQAGGEVWFGCLGDGAVVDGKRVVGAVVVTPYGRGVVLAKVVIDGTGNADVAAAAGAETRFVEDNFALQGSHMPPREVGAFYINGELTSVDVADPLDVRQALGQRQERFFDRGTLVDSRERRRIVGDYTLDWLDEINHRTFTDTIAHGQSDYDSHGYQIHPFFTLRPTRPPGDSRYQFQSDVPYRCLLPAGLENMLVVGIGLSVHRDALPIVRMQPDQQNLGYAAGVAAAQASQAGVPPRQVDVRKLQRHLVEVGNLPPAVLQQQDSRPFTPAELAAAVTTIPQGYAGLEVLMAQPQDALPLLRQAWAASTGAAKLAYAQVLGVMGDSQGLDTLLAEAQRRLQTGDFARPSTNLNTEPLVQLLWALGRSGDRRVVPVLGAFSTEAARLSFQRFRAIAVSLGQLRDPTAAPVLEAMVKSCNEKGDAGELIAACALLRCGDPDGLAHRTLERFVQGANGPFSRLAWQVLQSSIRIAP